MWFGNLNNQKGLVISSQNTFCRFKLRGQDKGAHSTKGRAAKAARQEGTTTSNTDLPSDTKLPITKDHRGWKLQQTNNTTQKGEYKTSFTSSRNQHALFCYVGKCTDQPSSVKVNSSRFTQRKVKHRHKLKTTSVNTVSSTFTPT